MFGVPTDNYHVPDGTGESAMTFGLKEFHARARQATIRVPLPTRIPQVGDYEDDVGVPTSRKKAGTNGDSRSRKQDYFDEGEDDEGDFEDGFDDYDEDEGGGSDVENLLNLVVVM